jgi:hypothetical protein
MHIEGAVWFIGALLLVAAATSPAGQSQVDVCIDYGCDLEHPIRVSQDEWHTIGSLFDEAGSAADERAAVALAVARFEQIAGLQAGTQGDLPENSGDHGGPGQLDCIAESINTHLYLQMLERASLLRWHLVKERAKRYRFVFSTHWSAVLERPDTGEAYAVDSWYGRNGDPALVIPLEQWRQGVRPDNGNR